MTSITTPITIKTKRTKFVDIDLSFRKNPITGDVARKLDENAIITSLKSLVQTEKFEHQFHPEVYSPVRRMLFENLTPEVLATIKRTIEYLIINFEPRVSLVSLSVLPYSNDAGIEVTIYFRVIGSTETIKTSFTLSRSL